MSAPDMHPDLRRAIVDWMRGKAPLKMAEIVHLPGDVPRRHGQGVRRSHSRRTGGARQGVESAGRA